MAGEEKELPELDPVRDNATADDFKTKNKVYELILYTGSELEQFPRAQRRLAEEIRETMLQILRRRWENLTTKLTYYATL